MENATQNATLNAEDLARAARAGCSEPGCTHAGESCRFWLAPKCHPFAQMEVRYHQKVLQLICGDCLRPVTSIAVAEA